MFMQEHPVASPRFEVIASHSRPTYKLTRRIDMSMEFTASRPMCEEVQVIDKHPTVKLVRLDRYTLA